MSAIELSGSVPDAAGTCKLPIREMSARAFSSSMTRIEIWRSLRLNFGRF